MESKRIVVEFHTLPKEMRPPMSALQLACMAFMCSLTHLAACDDLLLEDVPTPRVVVYPAPPDEEPSADFTVVLHPSASEHPDVQAAEQQSVFVYASYMFNAASSHQLWGRPVSNVSFTYFDFGGGPVSLVITVKHNRTFPDDLGEVVVRPLSAGLQLRPPPVGLDAKHSATLTLRGPINLSVEPWGLEAPLHIFANPLEHDVPTASTPGVLFFGPGVHFVNNPVEIPDDTTVYIAGGAIIKSNYDPDAPVSGNTGGTYGYNFSTIPSTFTAMWKGGVRARNVTIRGRGIIDGRHTFQHRQRHKLIQVQFADHIKIEGVVLRESSAWNVMLDHSSKVHVDNVKVIAHFCNSDGLDMCGLTDSLVERSFIHNGTHAGHPPCFERVNLFPLAAIEFSGLGVHGIGDDSFVVKAWNDVRNLTVRNCVAWSDVATAFGVSAEIFASVSDTSFKDCTAIHSMASGAYGGILTVHIEAGTNGSVASTTFENIVLEDAPVPGCDLMLLKIDPPRPSATISGVQFRNITAPHSAAVAPVRLSPGNGSTNAGLIESVLFDNVRVNHKPLGALDIVNENPARARNITNELAELTIAVNRDNVHTDQLLQAAHLTT
jgi:hypothetical protein